MRKPEEIKRGLEKHRELILFNPMTGENIDPLFLNEENRDAYDVMGGALSCIRYLEEEVQIQRNIVALNNRTIDEQAMYVQQLVDRVQELEREKEALIKVAHGQCRACKHKLSFSSLDEPCCKCRNIWPGHGFESRWEWRGVGEDDHAED